VSSMAHLEKPPIALAFYTDGIDDYVEVPYDPSFQFGTGDFTIEIWVKTTETPTETKHFIGTYNDVAVTPFYAVVLLPTGEGRVAIRDVEGDIAYVDIGIVNDGKWRQLVLRRTETALYGYNNLKEYSVDASAVGDTSNTYDLWIMRVWSLYIDSIIALPHAYDRALSLTEISDRYSVRRNIMDGCVLKLGTLGLVRGGGTQWLDESPYKNHGTVYGAKRVRCCHCNVVRDYGA